MGVKHICMGVKDISAVGCIGGTNSSVSIVNRPHSGRLKSCVPSPGTEYSYSSFFISFRPVLRPTQLLI